MKNEHGSGEVKVIRWIVALATFVGVPVATGMTIVPAITGMTIRTIVLRWPLLSMAILVIYALGLLLLRFGMRVWQRLQIRWVEDVADAIAGIVETVLSFFRIPYYCQQVVHRHKAFDVKGLGVQGIYTLQMEQVFVDLGIIAQPVHKASTELLGKPLDLATNRRYTIGDLLKTTDLPFLSMVVVGPPGSGKTTLLKHLTLTLAANKLDRKYRRVPIFLFLREHAEMIRKSSAIDLMSVIEASLPSINYTGSTRWIRFKLRHGRCVVMLDGLDEIASSGTRKIVASWIERQISSYSTTRFIITSRPFGYKANPIEGVNVFEVRPFTAHQVRLFVNNWYLANEIMAAGGKNDPGTQMRARGGAQDLLARLNKAWDLAELAVNPLLLTMIATVHRFRSALPGRRVALYSEMCDVFLGNRQKAKGINTGDLDLDPKQKRRVLEPLAYEMMNRKTREIRRADALEIIKTTLAAVTSKIKPESFLKDIEDFSGVLLERENGVYSFAHLTFQEFLSAAHVRSHQLEGEVIGHINDSWWHEVIRLYCAEGDASGIIKACLSTQAPTIEALTLATQCMDEAFEVRPELRTKLEQVLVIASADGAKRLLAKQRIQLRIRRLLRNEDRLVLDESLITGSEYSLFLEDMSSSTEPLRPDFMADGGLLLRDMAIPIAGIRGSAARKFCDWLTSLHGTTSIFRIPTIEEARSLHLNVSSLQVPMHYWVSKGESTEMEAAYDLSESSYLPDVRRIVERDLALLVSTDFGVLGGIEIIRESWKHDKIKPSVWARLSSIVTYSPAIDLDRLATYEITSSEPLEKVSEEPITRLLAETVFMAARLLFLHTPDAGISDAYFEMVSLVLSHRSSDTSREEGVALDLIGAMVGNDERWKNWSNEQGASLDLANMRSFRSVSAAPLQSISHRYRVAGDAVSIFTGNDGFEADRRTADGIGEDDDLARLDKDEARKNGSRLRALIRLLTLTVAWIMLTNRKWGSDELDKGLDLKTEAQLLQLMFSLCIAEERIGARLLPVEGIRIVRESRLDTLEGLFFQEESVSEQVEVALASGVENG